MSKQSNAKKLIEILNQKSNNAIQAAKQVILEQKFSQDKINQTIQQYTARWNDATRPGTLALSHEIVGGAPGKATALQTALLLIDATMDLHDDIIDESTSKKNVKTIYGKIGKEATILLGDQFMVKGFHQLHKAIEGLPKDKQDQIIVAVHDFLTEIVDAHITEANLKSKKWKVAPETYLQVLKKKAADIDGRMKIGAIFAGGTEKEISSLSKLGRNLGVLFVIRAEFVDIYEVDELSNRVKNECLPLPILYAIQNSITKAKIRKILNKDKITETDCEAVLQILDKTKNVLSLKKYMIELKNESNKLLESLNENQARNTLQRLVDSLLEDL